MQLLVITNNPDHASFRLRVALHLNRLESHGIHFEVATLPAGMFARRRLLRYAGGFDGIVLHRKILNAWNAFWLKRYRKKVIYDFDDAIMYSDRTPEQFSRLRFGRFARSVRLSNLVVAGNEYLAKHARRYNPNVRVLPTALELEPYRTKAPQRNDGVVRLVWIGSRSTLRYLREIAPALEEVGRRCHNVTLRIICNTFLDLNSMKVERHSWSKETEADDLMTGDIGLAPLSDNAFTRGKCGFKILQYQAAGLPVVASPVGVNAQYVRPGETGFHATSLAEWTDALVRLIHDRDLRCKMGRAGTDHVKDFDAPTIGGQWAQWVDACLRAPAS